MKTIVTKNIMDCAQLLRQSQVVAFPTETVYGLGAVATDEGAVQKIYKIKKRPIDNPLICHFADAEQVKRYVQEIPMYVHVLVDEFWPGPLSLLLPVKGTELLPATRGSSGVICRVPDSKVTRELISLIDYPLAGPSCNLSGRPSHTDTEMIVREFEGKIGAILDGGKADIGLESTILDCRKANICTILRPGSIGVEEIQEVFGRHSISVKVQEYKEKSEQNGVIPGNKYPHYSPETPLYKGSKEDIQEHIAGSGEEEIIILGSTKSISSFQHIRIIEVGNTLEEYSHNLYRKLQYVDTLNVDRAYLLIEDFGQSSLAQALANRVGKIGKDL